MADEDWIYGIPNIEEINRNWERWKDFYNAGQEAQIEEDKRIASGISPRRKFPFVNRSDDNLIEAYKIGKKSQKEKSKLKASEESKKRRRWSLRRRDKNH